MAGHGGLGVKTTVARLAVGAVGAPIAVGKKVAGAPIVADAIVCPQRIAVIVAVVVAAGARVLTYGVPRYVIGGCVLSGQTTTG